MSTMRHAVTAPCAGTEGSSPHESWAAAGCTCQQTAETVMRRLYILRRWPLHPLAGAEMHTKQDLLACHALYRDRYLCRQSRRRPQGNLAAAGCGWRWTAATTTWPLRTPRRSSLLPPPTRSSATNPLVGYAGLGININLQMISDIRIWLMCFKSSHLVQTVAKTEL